MAARHLTRSLTVSTVRRRFLRQNRDIARINSTQSLRIRSLENECARMLSENLQLRGQILHLESELRESSAQRIADHAMEIKEKMEAQLLEWGTMLANLGNEPLPRNRSPRAHKKARLQPSPRRSSGFQWQRRDPTPETMREMEDAANQEGRLAPIWENKSCPRGTLGYVGFNVADLEFSLTLPRKCSCDEILALQEESEQTNISPDFEPVRSSKLEQRDPVKIDIPTREVQTAMAAALIDESVDQLPIANEPESNPAQSTSLPMEKSTDSAASLPSEAEDRKSTLKRKIRTDEDRELVGPQTQSKDLLLALNLPTGKTSQNSTAQPVRTIKSLPLGKKETKQVGSTSLSAAPQRKPLGMKNSNDPIKSPKKAGKPTPLDDIIKPKTDAKLTESDKPRPRAKKDIQISTPVQIPTPVLREPTVVTVDVDPSSLHAEPNLNTPFSPESASREDVKDTPPPAHISSLGETARASRRARSAVSYAEPNLRDKMRRPTKELYDAVSGEGKNIRRHSQSKRDDLPSALGAISISASGEKSQVWRDFPQRHITDATEANPAAGIAASPLATKVSKDLSADCLPLSLGASRGSRNSGTRIEPESKAKPSIRRTEADDDRMLDEHDVYDFPATTSEDDSKHVDKDQNGSRKTGGNRHSRARRLSSIPGEDSANSGSDDSRATKTSESKVAARKRASMAAPKKSKMSLGPADQDAMTEGDSQASILSTSSNETADALLKDRGALRRRSMML